MTRHAETVGLRSGSLQPVNDLADRSHFDGRDRRMLSFRTAPVVKSPLLSSCADPTLGEHAPRSALVTRVPRRRWGAMPAAYIPLGVTDASPRLAITWTAALWGIAVAAFGLARPLWLALLSPIAGGRPIW